MLLKEFGLFKKGQFKKNFKEKLIQFYNFFFNKIIFLNFLLTKFFLLVYNFSSSIASKTISITNNYARKNKFNSSLSHKSSLENATQVKPSKC